MSEAPHGGGSRGERGIALITVILALVALAVIATPFALSMRGLQAQALYGFEQEAARADCDLALAAARAHLEQTHPFLDSATPWSDDRSELSPPDLAQRYPELLSRAPLGTIRSVSITDEQGKVDLATASPYLLGNILGGRTLLTADIDERATSLPVASTAGFPDTGLAWLGREQVEYSLREPTLLGEVRRGLPSAAMPLSPALPHATEDDVLDGRLLLLCQHGWRIRPGVFDGFRRVDGLKEISLYGELAYTAEDLDRARASLTVAGGPLRFVASQRVLTLATGREGGPELVVPDGRRFGAGTVLQLTTGGGDTEWNLALDCVDWGGGEGWHVALLLPTTLRHDSGSTVAALARHPVNVASASPRVLGALFAGVGRSPTTDVINAREAAVLSTALLAVDAGTDKNDLFDALAPAIRRGEFSLDDLDTALDAIGGARGLRTAPDAEALAGQLAGLVTRRSPQRVSTVAARELAERLTARPPRSHEDFALRLDEAVAQGVLRAPQRDALLRNALDSSDAALSGGTAPFTYASGGVFSVDAAVSRNFPNGREQVRALRSQILSVAPQGESAHTLVSQRDFEEASEPGAGQHGWSSAPRLLQSGPGPAGTAGGVDAFAEALALGGAGVSRAGTLVAGRPGPAEDGASAVSPSTLRSTLPDTLHFDEGLVGLTGDSPKGYSFAQGPVSLPLAGIVPSLVSKQPLLGTFAVEFWWQVPDTKAEVILFDGGAGELEDRILIALIGGELVLRVSDTSLPDFEAVMPKGHAPPAGEIRYAFDDGLKLLPDTPYHVLASVGGARDTQLALFVDGLPRGHRSFTTALAEDLASANTQLEGIAGYGGEEKVRVESTAGFPDRGAVRIGTEILEYVEKTDDSFVVRRAGEVDSFGGRGRRGTAALKHDATELVELVGWSRALGSERASQGIASLNGDMDVFTIAELDPTRLTDEISVSIVPNSGGAPVTVPLGTGLAYGNSTLPLRGGGGSALKSGSFQSGGGFAILFCDYGRSAVAGQRIPNPNAPNNPQDSVTLPAQTTGGWLGGGEIVRYSGFDGSQLTGVQRNQAGIPVATGGKGSSLAGTDQVDSVSGGSTGWAEQREYVTTFDAAILGAIQGLPENPRVFVFPLSVGVTGSNLFEDFHPAPDGRLSAPSAVVQVGIDFEDADNATEWMRWNTATDLGFVRDDSTALDSGLTYLMATGLWDPGNGAPDDDTAKALNDELDFRAQDGTPMSHHGSGDRVLPTIVLGRWFSSGNDPLVGIPGRHDSVTLVNTDGDKEWNRINHASNQDPEWGSNFCLVGLREAVSGEFLYTDETDDSNYALAGLPLQGQVSADSTAFDIIKSLNADSRLYTRMLCSPSGELPTAPIEAFHMGADWSGRPSTGLAIVDELRFHAPVGSGEYLPDNGRCLLGEDLELEENRQLRLGVEALAFPYGQRRDPVLGGGALEVLGSLGQAGGLLLVGEEIVGYAGLDAVDSGNVFLTARGLYGTQRAFHRAGEAVTALQFWPVSPLASSVTASSGHLPLADSSGFPADGGLVWVGDELIDYTSRDESGLNLPVATTGSRLQLSSEGLLRGRFGTVAAEHPAGTLVRWMPARVADRAMLGHDVPESESLRLTVRAPGAFFTDLIVDALLPDSKVSLQLRAVLDGRASAHDDATKHPGLLALAPADGRVQPSGRMQFALGRQADVLELFLFSEWARDAFDARSYTSNAWKLAPEVRALVVGHAQPTLVLEQEDRR